jgi:membrane protease YdiL (CAAX protease family)
MIKRYNTYLPDLKESWILAFFLIVGGGLLGGSISIIINTFCPSLASWSTMISYPLLFLPPYLWISFSSRMNPGNAVPFDAPVYGPLGAPLFYILILPLVFSFNIVTEPLYSWMKVPEFIEKLLEQVSDNRISGLIMLVILAPLLEETFCRGIILRGLLTKMTPWKAIFWSSLIFGIIHLNPWQAIPAFTTGLLIGWIYYVSRSLWAAIFIHFITNGTSFLITVLYPELPADFTFRRLIPGDFYYLVYFTALVITATILYTIKKNYDTTISNKIQSDN